MQYETQGRCAQGKPTKWLGKYDIEFESLKECTETNRRKWLEYMGKKNGVPNVKQLSTPSTFQNMTICKVFWAYASTDFITATNSALHSQTLHVFHPFLAVPKSRKATGLAQTGILALEDCIDANFHGSKDRVELSLKIGYALSTFANQRGWILGNHSAVDSRSTGKGCI